MLSTKVNSKWILDLNVKHKNLKRLEDNTEENLQCLWLDEGYLDMTAKNHHKGKKNLINCISSKLKLFFVKDPFERMKRTNHQRVKNICELHI